jgi:glycosyltransferase involved in cell wall biosynthesis
MSKKSEPLVSVVVPVRNNERTIREVLEALKSQTYRNIEIIIVDGASEDRTVEIASQFDVKILIEDARGPNYARNLGVKNAKGEFISFIDGDCRPHATWIEKILGSFSDPKVGVVGGTINVWNSNSYLATYGHFAKIPVMPRFEVRMVQDMKMFNELPVSTSMAVRKAVFDEAGLFDESYRGGFEETEFLWRVVKSGYNLVDEPLAMVYHWNRETLFGLLSQTWRYGIGAGKFCNENPDSPVTKKYHLYDLCFLGFVCLFLSMLFGSYRIPQLLFVVAMMPILLLARSSLWYFEQAFQRKAWSTPIFYPLLDYLRAATFCFAQIHSELLEKLRRKD